MARRTRDWRKCRRLWKLPRRNWKRRKRNRPEALPRPKGCCSWCRWPRKSRMPKKDKSENFKSQYRKSNPNNPIECWTNIVNLPSNSLFQCTQSRTSQVETSRNCTATRGQYIQNYFYYSPSRNFENAIKSILLFFSFCIESNLQIRNILHIYIYIWFPCNDRNRISKLASMEKRLINCLSQFSRWPPPLDTTRTRTIFVFACFITIVCFFSMFVRPIVSQLQLYIYT